MADLDVKEERDYDRRGTDSYRGGGNKRRRDGKLLMAFDFCLKANRMQMRITTRNAMIDVGLRGAAETILLAAATKNHLSPSCDACY